MKKFKLTLKEVTFHEVEVEAASIDKAVDKLEQEWEEYINSETENHGHTLIEDSNGKELCEVANW